MNTLLERESPPMTVGCEMHRLAAELYPFARSITGDGVRRTLETLKREMPLSIYEVPSGTRVFDWTVPREWNISDAWIKNEKGEKIVDLKNSNLHVLNYSVPVHGRFTLDELKGHLFTSAEHPDWIPYRTSYYKEDWGFCMSHKDYERMEEGRYEVLIDSELKPGYLTYGECFVEGLTGEEVLISTHVCHPSLANDNLSGIAASAFLAKQLSGLDSRLSYRFLFIPGTIGAITWLALNESKIRKIRHCLVLACLGDPGMFSYKKSRSGSSPIDRAAINCLRHSGKNYRLQEFIPFGYDERQYNSPGIGIQAGCLMRTPHGMYPEYHTSADDLDLIRPECLEESLGLLLSIMKTLDGDLKYINMNPRCEPQLGKRGLYPPTGGQAERKSAEMALLWVLNLSDGGNSLLDISERSGLPFELVKNAASALAEKGLLGAA